MKKERNEGITMIVLVITIIVLIVLAGVSVAMLIGPNGIITQANEAKTLNEIMNAKEKLDIQVLRKL